MDFTINASEGFLNTDIAIKTVGMEQGVNYKISFSDGSDTAELNGDMIVYKKFSSPGIHSITLTCDGQRVTKSIRIIDAHKFGNGKSLGFAFFKNRRVIIQKKTTGINVYYRELGKYISLPYRPDEYYEVDEHRIAFIMKDWRKINRIGLFNIDEASIQEDIQTTGGFTVPKSNTLCYYTDDNIYVFSDNSSLSIEGKVELVNTNNTGLFYWKGASLVYLSIEPLCSTIVGDFTSVRVTSAPHLVFLLGNNGNMVWNTKMRKGVYQTQIKNLTFFKGGGFVEGLVNVPTALRDPNGYDSCGISYDYDVKSAQSDRYKIIIFNDFFYLKDSKRDDYFSLGKFFPHEFCGIYFGDWICYKTPDSLYRLYSVGSRDTLDCDTRIDHAILYKEERVFITSGDDKTHFYRIVGQNIEKIASYKGSYGCDRESDSLLCENDIVWVRYGYKKLLGYKAFSGEVIIEFSYLKRFGDWYQQDDHTLVNIKTLQTISSCQEPLESLREDESEALAVRSDGVYLIRIKPESMETRIFEPDVEYESADILPNGKIIVLNDGKNTEIHSLDKSEFIRLEKTDFIEIDEGNIVVRDAQGYSHVRLTDQNTYELVQNDASNYKNYHFTNHKGNLRSDSWGNNHRVHEKIVILDKGNNSYHDIPIESRPDYINYISFSRDDDFVAFGGKYLDLNKGVMEILALQKSNTGLVGITANIDNTHYAIWKVVFSPIQNILAYYDSRPTTSVYDYSVNGKLVKKYDLDNRSVECFSPDGNYLVLSQNRYEATTIGGAGWCPSNKIFLAKVDCGSEIKEFGEHNAPVTFANISNEGNKMITRSEDGIVIVRDV